MIRPVSRLLPLVAPGVALAASALVAEDKKPTPDNTPPEGFTRAVQRQGPDQLERPAGRAARQPVRAGEGYARAVEDAPRRRPTSTCASTGR